MNQEFKMNKLTALLLGTAISFAFTADAFAENKQLALVKEYWNANNGKTGSYLELSGMLGEIDDIKAGYNFNRPDSTWGMQQGHGGKVQLGYDFGKIRFDWRLGALRSQVDNIDNEPLERGTADDAVLAFTTLNLNVDLYRFEVWNDIAITPYVGGGAGMGGGWITGKKDSDGPGAQSKRDNASGGFAYSGEAGILFNLTSWAGITLGYNYLHIDFSGAQVGTQVGSVGLRLTY
jgi:opacity protein-like surface antigen